MKRIELSGYQEFLNSDWVLAQLVKLARLIDISFPSQRWLLESGSKRYVFSCLYAELLKSQTERFSVLDIGGGLTSFTRPLVKKHSYQVAQLSAHDDEALVKTFEKECGQSFVTFSDWRDVSLHQYELVIANDIFPNVDQGLDTFLALAREAHTRVKLSLTWHTPRVHYRLRRSDGNELLTMVSWTGDQLLHSLMPYIPLIRDYSSKVILDSATSIFPNGRNVALIEMDFRSKKRISSHP